MEPLQNENIEEFDDKEYAVRTEQRNQRRMQKKKRRQQQVFLTKLLLGLFALCLLLAIAVMLLSHSKAPKAAAPKASPAATPAVTPAPSHSPVTAAPASPTPAPATPTPAAPTPVYCFEEDAQTQLIDSEDIISEHAILVNASTDTVAAAKGAYDRISPASMTKVLTILVAAEQLTEKQLDDTFTMTLEITDYAYVNDCSSVGFLNEEIITVRDLFYGTILPSGGDAAVGLATYVAGSHEAFVGLMNEKLDALGLSESAHFTNCVGLYDKEHYCTVYDMAVIMKAAMQNEWCREVLSAHTYTTTPTTEHPEGITISNWFLRRIEDKETGGLVVGGKTGYVAQSGSCAVSYQEAENQTPYICVTAGSSSSWRCIYDHVEIYNSYMQE